RASAETGEGEPAGHPGPRREQAGQPAGQRHPDNRASKQRRAGDDAAPAAARRALAPGDVDASGGDDENGQVRNDADNSPVAAGSPRLSPPGGPATGPRRLLSRFLRTYRAASVPHW